MKDVKCLFVRHGKTKGNLEKRYIGCRTDEPLCQEGMDELLSSTLLKGQRFCGGVFVSPLRRCLQTADILFPQAKQILVEDFREIDFGAFEKKNYQELQHNPDYQNWLDSNGSLPFPEGEAREAFVARNIRAFKKVLMEACKDCGEEIIPFVIHGGSIMAILSELTGGDYFDYQIACGDAYLLHAVLKEEKIDVVSLDRISNRRDT